MPGRRSGKKAAEELVEWKIISSSTELDGDGHEIWTWANPAGVIFLGRVSDSFEWKIHLSSSNVSALSDDAPVMEGVSPKQAFRETKAANGKVPFAIWYLYTREGLPVLRGPTNASSANKIYIVSADLNERSLDRYKVAEETIKRNHQADAAAEAAEKKRLEDEAAEELRRIKADIAQMEKSAIEQQAAADRAADEADAKADAKSAADEKAAEEAAEEAEARAVAADRAAEEAIEAKKLEREAAMEAQIIAKIEEARGAIQNKLLTVTGIKAGESAAVRIDKVNDAMDLIGETTSCRPWRPQGTDWGKRNTRCGETRTINSTLMTKPSNICVTVTPKSDCSSPSGPFRNMRDWVCDNGGHVVFEEELDAWFGTNSEGISKLMDKGKVFSQGDIDSWIGDELDKQKDKIRRKAAEDLKKENAEKDKAFKKKFEEEQTQRKKQTEKDKKEREKQVEDDKKQRQKDKKAREKQKKQDKKDREEKSKQARKKAEEDIQKKKDDLAQQQKEARDLKAARKENLRRAREAEEWRESLKQEAIKAREEARFQDAVHKRARDTLHRAKVKVALVPETPGNPTGALRGADVSIAAAYHSDISAERHVLAIVDVSASMEPLISDVKASLKSLVNRKDVNAHLSLYKRVDEAKTQNVAEDRMDMQVGEVVSLDPNISTVRIRCGWGNAKEGSACDLDGGMALFTDKGPLQQGVCYFERTSLTYDGNLAVTLNTDARGDGNEGAVPGKPGHSREVLICKLDKLPEEVTSVICYVCCYNGSFSNAKDVDISVDDVTSVVKKSGDNATALRNEPGVVLARSSANSVDGLAGRSGLVLGAFNKLPDNTWYFESIQQTASGSDPNAAGMRDAFNAYIVEMDADRQTELARRAEAKAAKEKLDAMIAEDRSRREWRESNPLALKGKKLKPTGDKSTLSYLGEVGEHVTGSTFLSVFDALKEECDETSTLTRPWPPHQTLAKMVLKCTDDLSTDRDHHITIVWVTSKEHEIDGKFIHAIQSKIDALAIRRVFVRVCVTGVSLGHEFASGKHVNALSSLTFDVNLRSVEGVSRGDGSATRPPMWAKLSVADAIRAIADDVVDVQAYLQLRLDIGDDCKIPMTAQVKDDLVGFSDPDMNAVRCLPASIFNLAHVAAMINNPETGPKPSLVWNDHHPHPPPMTRATLLDWLRKQLCLLFLSTENPGPAVKAFYWGPMSTVQVAHMLTGQLEGSYLLRKSTEGYQPYIISVVCNGHIRDVEISSTGRACRWNFRNSAFPDDEPCETIDAFINRHKTEPLIATFNIGNKTYHDQVLLRNPRPVPRTQVIDPPLTLDKVEGTLLKESIQGLLVEMSSAWFNPERGGVDGKTILANGADKDGNVNVSAFLGKVADARLKSCADTARINFEAIEPATADPVPGPTTYELLKAPWMRPVATPAGIKYLQAVRMLQADAHEWASSWTNRISAEILAKEQSLLETYGVVDDEADLAEVITQAEDAQDMKAGEKLTLDAKVTTVRIRAQWKCKDNKTCDLDAGITMYKGKELWRTCDFQKENLTIPSDVDPEAVTLNTDDQGKGAESEEIIVCKLDKLPADVTTCICYVVVYASARAGDSEQPLFKDAKDIAIQIDDVSNLAAAGADAATFKTGTAVATLAKSNASENTAMLEKQGFLLGAFTRADDGSWYFESLQRPVNGKCGQAKEPCMVTAFEEHAKLMEDTKQAMAEKRAAEKKRREDEAAKRAAEMKGGSYFKQLKIELARVESEKASYITRHNEIDEELRIERVSIAMTIWNLFQDDLAESYVELGAKIDELDSLFLTAAQEAKAMHFGSFTQLEEVTAFLEGHWHAEILEDEGVVDSTDEFAGRHTAKQLFFQSIVDNEEIPFVLGRARAWTVTLKKQILSWTESVGAFSGVKLLHLLLHTDLEQAHLRFKQLYGEWLKMRSQEWKSVKYGGNNAVESAAHRQDGNFQLNDSMGDYGGHNGTKVHPQQWLQKKSSVPRLEEFHPVMKAQEILGQREREHEAHKIEVAKASALVASNAAAATAARQKRRAETEAKSKAFAEERRQKWSTQNRSFAPKAKKSELAKKLSSTRFKIFGFDGEEDTETDAVGGEWGFNEHKPPSAKKEAVVAEPAHDHEVLGSSNEIHVTVKMPMGLSLGKDKVGPGYHVKLLSDTGHALKTGKIKENMKIVRVNGVDVDGIAKSVVMKNIRKNKQFCDLVLHDTHISENPRAQEIKTTVHGTSFGSGAVAKRAEKAPAEKQKPKSKGGKAKAKVGEWFNTLRRKKLQAGEVVTDNAKDIRVVLRTMSFGPTSEFESCREGEEVTVVREFPDHSLLCMTEEGKVLFHGDAFKKAPDEMDGLELDMFDGGAEEA